MKLSNVIANTKIKVRAHADIICLVGGLVTGAAAIVTAVKAGMDTPMILDEREHQIERITKAYDDPDKDYEYTEEDRDHDIKKANKTAVFDLLKKYAPTVAFATVSATLLICGRNVLSNRNAALANALATTNAAFNGYRDRVRSYLGSEKEMEVYNGMYKEKTVDSETGEVKEVEKVEVNHTLYDRCFDETNGYWVDEAFENQSFLYRTQRYLNQQLQDRCVGDDGCGFVTLNEVYHALGFERCPDGQTLGWYYEANGHKGVIDLGIGSEDQPHRLFQNGLEKSVWLRFNFDGDIMQVAKKKGVREFT